MYRAPEVRENLTFEDVPRSKNVSLVEIASVGIERIKVVLRKVSILIAWSLDRPVFFSVLFSCESLSLHKDFVRPVLSLGVARDESLSLRLRRMPKTPLRYLEGFHVHLVHLVHPKPAYFERFELFNVV